MDFGAIIKRAWHITWHYRYLWILGLFAGAAGSGGGGTGGGGGSQGTGSDFSGGSGSLPDLRGAERALDRMVDYLPIIIAATIVLMLVGFVWWILSVAARGGLIAGVNVIEEGSERRLGELWSAGFQRFWPMVGLDILVQLPLIIVGLAMAGFIAIPFVAAAVSGGEPGAEVLGPLCGSLLIGVPLLLVGGFVLGFMRLLGQRYIVLGGQGPIEAAKNGWRFLRARLKDSFLMFLINWALSIGASFVLAIPVVVVAFGLALPLGAAVATEEWGATVALGAVLIALLTLIGFAYSAVWGTFTSALWTLFFRQVAGMGSPRGVVAAPAQIAPAQPLIAAEPSAQPEPPIAVTPPVEPGPPIAVTPPEQPPADA